MNPTQNIPSPTPPHRHRKILSAKSFALAISILFLIATASTADTLYYHHIFFDNSLERDAYFYSSGNASARSSAPAVLVGAR